MATTNDPGQTADDAHRGGISRRHLLGMAGAAGLAAPLLLGHSPAWAASRVPAPRRMRPQGTFDGALKMTAWEAYPDQIRANLDTFTEQFGTEVELDLIPNVGYGPALQTRLQGGDEIDAYYNFAYNSTKFIEAGWAQTLNDRPGVEDMLADMFPTAAERHRLPDGRIISVPYFSAVHLLHYNAKQLEDNSIAAPPATLAEVYSQCEQLKAAGIAAPYAAYWTKQFVEEYLILYLVAEGIVPFDAEGNPVFQDDPKTIDVFSWWQSMYQDGLTSPTILTDDPGAHVIAMAQGNSSFFTLHHYFLNEIRNTDGPEAENVTLAYTMPGANGQSLQIGEVVQLGTKDAGPRADQAWELLKFYGWKDAEGRYGTFISWAQAAALLAPYPELFADEEFRAAFPESYDLDALSTAFEASQVVPARVLPWYASFQTKVGDRIHELLLGDASPEETASRLADDAKEFAENEG